MKERIEWHKKLEWRKKFEQVASEKGFKVSKEVPRILEVAIKEKNQEIKSGDHLESMMVTLAEDALAHATEKGRKEIIPEDINYALSICRFYPLC